MKVVINRCFGGFGLSQEAYVKLNEWGIPIVDYVEQKIDPKTNRYEEFAFKDQEVLMQGGRGSFYGNPDNDLWETWLREKRDHELLVRVVEELGDAANGDFAKLKVVEISDGISYEIDDYDGMESIHESHSSWS